MTAQNNIEHHNNQIQEYTGDRNSTTSLVLSSESMESMLKVAGVMAQGAATVPKHLQGNQSDCLAVTMQAMQWKMNPFAVAQKTHIVNGALGYEAQLVNAVLQSSGAIEGRFYYEYEGEGNGLKCRVGALPAGESEIQWGEWLAKSSVTTQNSPLWKTNPKQQLGYLQVKNWARQYAPGAILGVYTPDELENIDPIDVTSRSSVVTEKKDPITTTISDQQAEQVRAALPAAGMDEAAFCEMARISCIEELQTVRFEGALNHVMNIAAQSDQQEAEA